LTGQAGIWWKRLTSFFVYGAVALVIAAVAVNEFVIAPRAEAARAARAPWKLETALSELTTARMQRAESAFARACRWRQQNWRAGRELSAAGAI